MFGENGHHSPHGAPSQRFWINKNMEAWQLSSTLLSTGNTMERDMNFGNTLVITMDLLMQQTNMFGFVQKGYYVLVHLNNNIEFET